MAISPWGLAGSLRKAVMRRALASEPSEVRLVATGATFKVYDNDGGILEVTVTQYKEAIR